MDEHDWYVSTHGDRVVLTLPSAEGEDAGYTYDMSTAGAREMAAALTEAAEAIGPPSAG